MQVFPSSPRTWAPSRFGADELVRFAHRLAEREAPLFVHAIYLINLASPDPGLRSRSASALADALWFGTWARAQGVVVHVGSHRGVEPDRALGRVRETWAQAAGQALARLREEGAGEPRLPPRLLETAAGGANAVGTRLEELAEVAEQAPAPWGLCLDTAHLFAAGAPVHTAQGVEAVLEEVGRRVGLERIGLVHLNDSKTALGSRRDRHENLWEGQIGRRGLAAWVRRPELQWVPFVLETPGFGQEGPDRRNLRRAKRLRR
ncbi:MAG: deoxyribonuclease IV [Deferrisomatales bacterium]